MATTDRIYRRIKVHPLGCWEWQGATTDGYGVVRTDDGRTERVHRVVFREEVGPIPDGLTLDHWCLNPCCCNPAHLEPVTRQVNTLRQWAAGRGNAGAGNVDKMHCPQGHPYDEKNTYVGTGGRRHCRICKRESWTRRYHERKAA